MHPSVAIVLLLVFAAGLPQLSLRQLLILSLGMLVALLLRGPLPPRRALAMLLRLRWLLAGLVVLYLAATPGEPLFAALPGLSREGLIEALRRALVLWSMIAAVIWLFAAISASELAAGLARLLDPLRALGLRSERFALRLSLTLDAAHAAQARLEAWPAPRGALDVVTDWIVAIEREAEAGDSGAPGIAALPRAPQWQWLLPPALIAALMLLP